MEIRISHEGLDITIAHKPNDEQILDKKPTKPTEGNDSELIPGIPNPFSQRDMKVVDEAWEYVEHLVDRGLI